MTSMVRDGVRDRRLAVLAAQDSRINGVEEKALHSKASIFQASEQVAEASQASSKTSSGVAHRPTHAARQADATPAR